MIENTSLVMHDALFNIMLLFFLNYGQKDDKVEYDLATLCKW